MTTTTKVMPKFQFNTPCSCGRFPALPKYRTRDGKDTFGVIRFPAGASWANYKEVHGYMTCWDNQREYTLGSRY